MANILTNLYDLLTTGYMQRPLKYSEGEAKRDYTPIQMSYHDNTPIELDENTMFNPVTQEERNNILGKKTFGTRLGEYFLGTPQKEVIGTDDNGNNIYSSETKRSGGFLRDLSEGYKENRNNSFSLDNWGEEKKNVAQRIGEILGTTARFVDSPLGRTALTAGLVGLNGGSGLQALTYGGMAGVGNQQNRMADRLYRDELIETKKQALMNNPQFNALSDVEKEQVLNNLHQDNNYLGLSTDEAKGLNTQQYRNALQTKQDKMKQEAYNNFLANRQNQQLQDVENSINGYKGYINSDTYKLLNQAQQIRDNYAYRNLMLKSLDENRKATIAAREQELQDKQADRQFQRDIKKAELGLKQQELGLGYAKLRNEENKPNVNFNEVMGVRKEFSSLAPVKNATEITRQYNNVNSLYAQYKQGKIGKNAFDQALITTLNKVLDPQSVVRESEFDRTSAGQAVWDKLGGYQQKLIKGGSGLTDANRADLVNALTIMKEANDNEVKNISRYYADLANRYGINPMDIMPRHYANSPTANTGSKYPEGTIIRNKEGKRMIMRGGKWQTL